VKVNGDLKQPFMNKLTEYYPSFKVFSPPFVILIATLQICKTKIQTRSVDNTTHIFHIGTT